MKMQTIKSMMPAVLLAVSAVLVTSCGNKQGGLPQSNEFPVMSIGTTSTQLDDSYPAVIKGKQDIEIRPKNLRLYHQSTRRRGQRCTRWPSTLHHRRRDLPGSRQ